MFCFEIVLCTQPGLSFAMQLRIICPGLHVGISGTPPRACLHLLFVVNPGRGVGAALLSVAWSPQSTEQGLWVVKQGSLALYDVERVFMFVCRKKSVQNSEPWVNRDILASNRSD